MREFYLCYKCIILIDFTDLLDDAPTEIEVDERLAAFVERHGPDGCRLYLEELRWPGGAECPRCGSGDVHWLERRARYNCRACHYQFRVTAQTVFHDSHLSLSKWFVAVALMLSRREGISAVQLRRILGGSYKSAWFLEHRIRSAMGSRATTPSTVPVAYAAGPVAGRRASRQVREAVHPAQAPPGWLLLRSVIAGAHGNVRAKYLAAYWNEARWRHENRRNPEAFRDTVLALLDHPWLPYQVLTAG
jgi:transposase-like protein